MTRKEFLRRLVLNEICDDYENLDMIRKWVFRTSERCGLRITEDEIIQSLAALIESGLAKAYLFRPKARQPDELSGMPPLGKIERYYFWVTPEGTALQRSGRDWYPFDDDDELRKDWSPPASETASS